MKARARPLLVVGTVALYGFSIGACGGGSAAAPGAEHAAKPASSASSSPSSASSSGGAAAGATPLARLRRRDIAAGLSGGLGAFLGRVEVEAELAEGGGFHGWKIVSLRGDPSLWGGVDLRPGDVVTSVNHMPIERPEQAMACWQSLAIAPELRVSLERGGQAKELVYPIDDEPSTAKSGKK